MFGQLEGTGYEVIDAEFGSCILGTAHVERLWTGGRWCEGPAWFGGGRYLVWSDIPNDRMLHYDDTDGSVSVFRAPAMNSNGNTTDRQGRLVTCELWRGGSPAPVMTARFRFLPTITRVGSSTRRTMSWNAPTGRSGSLIPTTAS